MNAALSVTAALLCALAVRAGEPPHALSDRFLALLNRQGRWQAGRNFARDTPVESLRRLAGVQLNASDYDAYPVVKHDLELIATLPESFDPRDKWPQCPSLNEIRDQGECGSCWAFSSTETMTDRVCTYSNGTKNFHFSAEDVLTCNTGGSSCEGGMDNIAWKDWVEFGFVSGGNYHSHIGCKTYSLPPCPNHLKNCLDHKPTPPCVQTCEDGYTTSYSKDRKRGKRFYTIEGEEHIKAELYKNGPAEALFLVYEDLADYKSGVYEHILGDILGCHAIKLMGWGVENGKKYWLMANSWGTSFGENGFFKILRGSNHCFIEQFVLTGEPLMEDY